MAGKRNAGSPAGPETPSARKDRLKDALKANIARRKAQAEARRASRPGGETAGGNNRGQ